MGKRENLLLILLPLATTQWNLSKAIKQWNLPKATKQWNLPKATK
jgi:hypothetical protein